MKKEYKDYLNKFNSIYIRVEINSITNMLLRILIKHLFIYLLANFQNTI